MKLFQGHCIDRVLCSIAGQTLEIGRENLETREAGQRIKLIAYVEELTFMKDAYTNICSFIQVNSITRRFDADQSLGFPRIHLPNMAESKKGTEICLIAAIQRLLRHLRDHHGVSVATLLQEVQTLPRLGNAMPGRNVGHNVGRNVGRNTGRRGRGFQVMR